MKLKLNKRATQLFESIIRDYTCKISNSTFGHKPEMVKLSRTNRIKFMMRGTYNEVDQHLRDIEDGMKEIQRNFVSKLTNTIITDLLEEGKDKIEGDGKLSCFKFPKCKIGDIVCTDGLTVKAKVLYKDDDFAILESMGKRPYKYIIALKANIMIRRGEIKGYYNEGWGGPPSEHNGKCFRYNISETFRDKMDQYDGLVPMMRSRDRETRLLGVNTFRIMLKANNG